MTTVSIDTDRHPALDYHEFPQPGKLEIRPTKPLANPRDLSRAYSPGVAEACMAIHAEPETASRYTARENLVAVVSNGSAAPGLGNIGPLASKPIMEGKAVLFKQFANIDCFDIELNQNDPVSWPSTSSLWSRPLAQSIWKTSRHRIVSSSRRSAESA